MKPMKIRLPAPPRDLSPNRSIRSRVHYHRRAKLVQEYHADLELIIGATFQAWRIPAPRIEVATVQATIYHRNGSWALDGDNALAWLKSFFDGLKWAGVFSDDRKLIHYPVVQLQNRRLNGLMDVFIRPEDQARIPLLELETPAPVLIGGITNA